MDTGIISGLIITPLKKIANPKGDIFHGIKKSDFGYNGFGEVYFSTINYNDIKPWKKHKKMTINFVVPVGEIQVVVYDDRENSSTKGKFNSFVFSINNYNRITIPPDVWVAFRGLSKELNLLLNIANIEHDPDEIERLELCDIVYQW
jgi:dTDP-4-dehydrorhamnose 3,5-epimerase